MQTSDFFKKKKKNPSHYAHGIELQLQGQYLHLCFWTKPRITNLKVYEFEKNLQCLRFYSLGLTCILISVALKTVLVNLNHKLSVLQKRSDVDKKAEGTPKLNPSPLKSFLPAAL